MGVPLWLPPGRVGEDSGVSVRHRRKSFGRDSQTAPVVSRVGFEPTTKGLKVPCSTTELPARIGPYHVQIGRSPVDSGGSCGPSDAHPDDHSGSDRAIAPHVEHLRATGTSERQPPTVISPVRRHERTYLGVIMSPVPRLPTVTAPRPAPALAACIAALMLLSSPAPARAECPYLPPWPALTEFGRSAREIIVGTVVGGGGSSVLDFRVDQVLRGGGKVGEVRKLENLLPNWPQGPGGVAVSCTYLIGDEGDVIALGFDALAPDGQTRINAAAWIEGTPDFWTADGYAEVATLAEIEAIAALPPTSTAPEVSPASAPSQLPHGLVLIALAIGASLIALQRRLAHGR
jgi:hypothetical protein